MEQLKEDRGNQQKGSTVVGNVNWYNHCEKQYGVSSKNKIELPYDPEILLLGIYPEKTIIQKDTCTPIFIAALYTIARTWKQTKCPLTDEWIKKMWYIYIYTMEYYSATEKNKIMPFAATWIDLVIIIPLLLLLSHFSRVQLCVTP